MLCDFSCQVNPLLVYKVKSITQNVVDSCGGIVVVVVVFEFEKFGSLSSWKVFSSRSKDVELKFPYLE